MCDYCEGKETEKKISLSDKKGFIPQKFGKPKMVIYHEEDVKEKVQDFIKELKENMKKGTFNLRQSLEEIDKLSKDIFGGNLI